MPLLLNDIQIQKLLGSVIVDADESSVYPNSYILRLGSKGEFLNSNLEFSLGEEKKGIKIAPGHSVAITAYETLDFRRETVHKIFPGCDLFAILTPISDLVREGIILQTSMVDPGYYGTINWTVINAIGSQRYFVFMERLFKLLLFKLDEGETPEKVYNGSYQGKLGYVRSERMGPPVGWTDRDWLSSIDESGTSDISNDFQKAGYPYSLMGKRFNDILDNYNELFDKVNENSERNENEFAEIQKKIDAFNSEMQHELRSLRTESRKTLNEIEVDYRKSKENWRDENIKAISRELDSFKTDERSRILVTLGLLLMGLLGFLLSLMGNQMALNFLRQHSSIIGGSLLFMVLLSIVLGGRNKDS